MTTNAFASLNQAQQSILRWLMDDGKPAEPRGRATRELLFCNFSIANPRKRLLTLSGRHWNMAVAIGEFCWHLAQSDDADFISYYAKDWADLATANCQIPGSSYGKTIFSSLHRDNQWNQVKTLLQADRETRRAVLFFNLSDERLNAQSKDVACASSAQFFIRQNRLDIIVTMRSNDAILGLPYDVFFFSMLQELMATMLGLHLGTYYHSVGSMHLYERHYSLAKRIIESAVFANDEMPKMPEVTSIPALLAFERSLRNAQKTDHDVHLDSDYWSDLAKILIWQRRQKDGLQSSGTSDGPYALLLKHLER